MRSSFAWRYPARDQLGHDAGGAVVGRMSSLYRQWDDVTREIAEREATRGWTLASELGLRSRPLVTCGKPAPTILRVADEHETATIVVGAGRALGGLLGSVSARVADEAARPVLVVRGSKRRGPSSEG